jgi:hypothetical protein
MLFFATARMIPLAADRIDPVIYCRIDPVPAAESVLSSWAKSVLFFTNLLPVALARKGFLDALLLSWLQVERMAFNFLDDVFGLHLALEASQRILKGFAFLNTNFCQLNTPPGPPKWLL